MASYNLEKAAFVTINNQRVANLLQVESEFNRELVITDGAITVPNTFMYITLRRQIFLNDQKRDGLNLRSLTDFSLSVYWPGVVSTFSNCQWLGFKETIVNDNIVIEEMRVASINYRMVSE